MDGLERRLASDFVQSQLPDLESEKGHALFAEYNHKKPLRYPRGERKIIESLITIGHCMTKHERHADIWKRQVRYC